MFYIEELAPRVILETILSGFWQKGNTVVHRYVGHADWVTWARPHIVVSDTSEITVLSQPEGTVVERFDRRDKVSLKSQTIRMDILRVMFPNRAYAVLLFFDAGTGVPPWYQEHFNWPDGAFKGWKIDLESIFKRTSIGFDTTDNTLDAIVRPDFTWYWKDEEGLARRVCQNVYTAEEAESFYAAGREAIQAVEKRLVPFSESWPQWRPDPMWTIPNVPAGWEDITGANTDLNRKAPRALQRFKEVE